MGIRLHGELGEKDEQLRERQRAAGRKYEEAHAVQRRERQHLAAQRRRERIIRLPPAEQEKIRARQRIHNANYRANHRSHLRKASMRRRSLANPDALPRRGHLYKPEEYAAHQLARHKLVNEFKTTKRRCMKAWSSDFNGGEVGLWYHGCPSHGDPHSHDAKALTARTRMHDDESAEDAQVLESAEDEATYTEDEDDEDATYPKTEDDDTYTETEDDAAYTETEDDATYTEDEDEHVDT
ncbi:hypothetical protein BDZ89DRAFT_1112479 [Hymenopellis radicata]|nr:hypothetical protein BDZ89DRAFT_1112479 [Hymenopellis radicata]